jgi:hypothetical protein
MRRTNQELQRKKKKKTTNCLNKCINVEENPKRKEVIKKKKCNQHGYEVSNVKKRTKSRDSFKSQKKKKKKKILRS